MRNKYSLILILLVLPFLGAQCIQFNSTTRAGVGGVFKSINSGIEWKQKSAIPTTSGTPASFASSDIVSFAQDPSDHLAIYAGTKENGMFYTYDGGESWRRPKEITSGRVNAAAVDAKDKCNIYVATVNRILKSTDCNRSFSEIYRDESEISSLVIDNYNSQNLYAGTAKGTILKSQDGGRTWTSLKNFAGRVVDIVVNPQDTRVIYAAVLRRGIWKSSDGGSDWSDLTDGFKKMTGSLEIKKLVISQSSPDGLVFASKYGLIGTNNGGNTWDEIKLLTKPGNVDIYSLAISPKDARNIFYGTASTFYRSQDGGATWSTKKLPTSRAATALLVDAQEPLVIYLGATKLEK